MGPVSGRGQLYNSGAWVIRTRFRGGFPSCGQVVINSFVASPSPKTRPKPLRAQRPKAKSLETPSFSPSPKKGVLLGLGATQLTEERSRPPRSCTCRRPPEQAQGLALGGGGGGSSWKITKAFDPTWGYLY